MTSKSEKSLHGFGIESIERTVNHYGGVFDWLYDNKDKIFETTIAIPKSEYYIAPIAKCSRCFYINK